MRKIFRLTVAMTAWLVAATALAPRAAQGHAEALPWQEETSASGVAQVRFVNGLNDAVAVEADDHLAFAGVKSQGTTRYAEVGAARARFVLRASDGSTLASVEDQLDADGRYTLVAGRDAGGGPVLVVLRDQDAGHAGAKHNGPMNVRTSS